MVVLARCKTADYSIRYSIFAFAISGRHKECGMALDDRHKQSVLIVSMNTKEKLVQHLLCLIEEKINTAKAEIESAREAQQNETKSSAGDKYETSREMMTQEIEKHSKSLSDSEQQKIILQRIAALKPPTAIELGSLVATNQGYYFLSVGMGIIVLEKKSVQTISLQSPIGKQLLNKQKGDTFMFKDKCYEIISVE
jgi:transcription elongation GreA/GreB family factor